MTRQLRVLMIGAHPDDCDILSGGTALRYARAGHAVKFLALCNGCGGHQSMAPDDLARRRQLETQAVARLAGIDYEVWDVPDCELMATLENRRRLVRDIRAFRPDVIFTSRPNDYHADHRNAAILMQDAGYLLIVPNFCPEAPALLRMPVVLFFYDRFQNPPFRPDLMVPIDDLIEDKYALLHCHTSQMYEWLPFTRGSLDQVPAGDAARLEWLHGPRLPRDGTVPDASLLGQATASPVAEIREATPAIKYREFLVQRFGEAGRRVLFAEAFAVSEYGTPLTPGLARELFPFLG